MQTTNEQTIKEVRNYKLSASNGRAIRTATLVEFTSGQIIKFTEKLPKYLAIKNALSSK
jgi:hypothetical protein